MSSGWLETAFISLSLAILASAAGALLVWLFVVRPRLGLYLLLALTPTQFLFAPARGFFISPADVLALAAAGGLATRLASGDPQARSAIRMHVMLGLVLTAYLVGFIVVGYFSPRIARFPLAVLPSILACELLVRRRHFAIATSALVVAGLVDAAYGAWFVALGAPLHPTRFSGMMGVNFSAVVIFSAAATAFARVARTRSPVGLILPGVLTVLGVATLSRMGILALGISGALVVWPLATPANRRRIAVAAVVLAVIGISQESIRERLSARASPEVQVDGVSRTSTEVRMLVLRTAWDALAERPLVGVGFANFEKYSISNATVNRSTAGLGYATHNTYLEVLVEGGLLAFVPLLFHFAAYARHLRPASLVITRRGDVLVGAALSSLIVVLISAGVANLLLHYLFWAVCGVALACLTRCSPNGAAGKREVMPSTPS